MSGGETGTAGNPGKRPVMGGKPSTGTKKDRRLKENKKPRKSK